MGVVVVGLGTEGNAVVDRVHARRQPGVHCVALDTDARALEGRRTPVRVLMGWEMLQGDGASCGAGAIATAVHKTRGEILKALGGEREVVLVARLGSEEADAAVRKVVEIVADGLRRVRVLGILPIGAEADARRKGEALFAELGALLDKTEILALPEQPQDPGMTLRLLNERVESVLDEAANRVEAMIAGERE